MDWISFKGFLEQLAVSKDALHIYAAMFIQLGSALLFRKPVSSLIPWFCVLALELLNEGLDLIFEKEPYIHQWQIDGSIHDVLNTMAMPTVVLLLARYVPNLFVRATGPSQEHE